MRVSWLAILSLALFKNESLPAFNTYPSPLIVVFCIRDTLFYTFTTHLYQKPFNGLKFSPYFFRTPNAWSFANDEQERDLVPKFFPPSPQPHNKHLRSIPARLQLAASSSHSSFLWCRRASSSWVWTTQARPPSLRSCLTRTSQPSHPHRSVSSGQGIMHFFCLVENRAHQQKKD